MITRAIIDAFIAIAGWLSILIPPISVPDWFVSVGSYISDGLGSVSAFGNILPVQALQNAFVFLLGTLAIGFGVRLIRILISTFSGGGGSAA